MSDRAASEIDLHTALKEATGRLVEAGAETARLDAELLMGRALGLSREELFLASARPLKGEETTYFEALVSRRIGREPVARILGTKEFWSMDFVLNEATLVPRPDSETLVVAVLQEIGEAKDNPLRILDLGTGTGCLLLALLSELPAAYGVGVDSDESALAAATDNARRLDLQGRTEFHQGDWFAALGPDAGGFDVIVSNPPYIPSGEIAELAPEVAKYDPRSALDGGADGLDAYRQIAAGARGVMAPGGLLVMELGAGQEDAVSRTLEDNGFTVRALYDDLAGVARVISAALAPG